MLPQYYIVNECLQVLKQLGIPTNKKLRLEIRLIQLKRWMLCEDYPMGACSEDALHEVLSAMRKARKGGCNVDDVNALIELVQSIFDGLSAEKIDAGPP